MSFTIKNLDDRQFEDLVAEATRRLQQNVPELRHLSPGDPAHAFIDLFAWLTETILYRANLITERQRQAFLNLLDMPFRSARPATSLVCIDTGPQATQLPEPVNNGTQLKAGKITFSTLGEVQPLPLRMHICIKQKVELAESDRLLIQSQYLNATDIIPFKATTLLPGIDKLELESTIDNFYYLAFTFSARQARNRVALLETMAGQILNIAIAPEHQLQADTDDNAAELNLERKLSWELVFQNEDGQFFFYPLLVKDDSSNGGKQAGIIRLALPENSQLLQPIIQDNPLMAGYGLAPPALPEAIKDNQLAFWLRLSCTDDPHLPLSYLAVNGIKVIAQGVTQDRMITRGNGMPDQQYDLQARDIDPASLILQVENGSQWETWQPVDYFQNHHPDDRIFKLDSTNGRVFFGNGINGKRPAEGMRIRAAFFRYGGGSTGNLPAGSISELINTSSRLQIRHEIPASGGVDAESTSAAEQRIGAFLNHRNRAVTRQDFIDLALENPVNPVARAEVISGLLPGNNINSVRENIPGVVSVFVIPPGNLEHRQFPKPSRGLLKDVYTWLQARTLLGTELYVLSPQFIPMAITVHIDVADPEQEQSILRAVETALYRYLWPVEPGGAHQQGWPFEHPVTTAELLIPVAKQDGVARINRVSLFLRQSEQWIKLTEQQNIPINQYQLPECLAISVRNLSGDTETELPDGLASTPQSSQAVAAPIIPESC